MAVSGRSRERNRPWQRVWRLRRSLLGVPGRRHASHRARLRLVIACGVLLQHRVDDSSTSTEASHQPAGSICSAAGSARLTKTGAVARASIQRSTNVPDGYPFDIPNGLKFIKTLMEGQPRGASTKEKNLVPGLVTARILKYYVQ